MQFEDEGMQNLKMIGDDVIRAGKALYRLICQMQPTSSLRQTLNEQNAINTNPANLPFVFSGQFTDLTYFKQSELMPAETLNQIPDGNIRAAVISNFEMAQKEGLISINPDSNFIFLTDKGKAYIRTPEFERAAQFDQNKAISDIVMNNEQLASNSVTYAVELNGTNSDLNFFRHAKELDLKQIAGSKSTEAAERVCVNVAKWEKEGLVTRSAGQTVQLTDKGRKLIQSKAFTESTHKLAEKSVEALGTAGKVVAITKKVFNAAKNVVSSQSQAKSQTQSL